jgi:hypothetical protein
MPAAHCFTVSTGANKDAPSELSIVLQAAITGIHLVDPVLAD